MDPIHARAEDVCMAAVALAAVGGGLYALAERLGAWFREWTANR